MGREGLGGHSKGVFILQIANTKRRFSRLGDRSIYYIADGPTQKKTVLTRFSESAVKNDGIPRERQLN